MIQSLKNLISAPRRKIYALIAFFTWFKSGFKSPAPTFVKWAVLRRYSLPGTTWVETGTYFGDTAKYLSKNASHVYSIEPSLFFAHQAVKRFERNKRITILNGISEVELPKLLPTLPPTVNFWLDGHFSAGNTFQGPSDTPIRQELGAISDNWLHFQKITIFVDDVRCFDPDLEGYETYPSREWLVQWADQHDLKWIVEHDIFIMSRSLHLT
jgi:hypothetical protein